MNETGRAKSFLLELVFDRGFSGWGQYGPPETVNLEFRTTSEIIVFSRPLLEIISPYGSTGL